MSDSPGGNTHPRDRRRNERSRKRNHRPTQGNGGGGAPEADPPRSERDCHEPHRERDRNDELAGSPGASGQVMATPTLRQKLLRVFTLGFLRPKSRTAKPGKESHDHHAGKNADVDVPPPDPGAVTSPRLFVGNLHEEITEDDLLNLFKGIGPVKSVDIVYNGYNHCSRGRGFVEFNHPDDARRAVAELHGLPYMRRPLLLGPAKSRGHDEREADADLPG